MVTNGARTCGDGFFLKLTFFHHSAPFITTTRTRVWASHVRGRKTARVINFIYVGAQVRQDAGTGKASFACESRVASDLPPQSKSRKARVVTCSLLMHIFSGERGERA